MPRTHLPYPPEFQVEALKLVREGGKAMSAVAKELGVSYESLRAWRNRAEIEEGKREGLTLEERARLRQLERENRVLKEEREILKKAAAFFAQETRR